MPYYGYYGGYGDYLANNLYCILLIPVLLLSLWAQAHRDQQNAVDIIR